MDTIIHMRNVPGDPFGRQLDAPLPYLKSDGTWGEVPTDFYWDGSSSEFISRHKSVLKRWLLRTIAFPINFVMRNFFPRHLHPIASCRHDWRCRHARTKEDRLFADREFRIDVEKTSWKVTGLLGYWGVRIGAKVGIGVYKDEDCSKTDTNNTP